MTEGSSPVMHDSWVIGTVPESVDKDHPTTVRKLY